MAHTLPRQNYHPDCEAGVNKQINLELYASYVYQSMAWYFDRDDVALPGFHKFFARASAEERIHAEALMAYQNRRGGRIVLQNIKRPDRDEWGSGLEAMKMALSLEKSVNQCLTDLRRLAESKGDVQFTHFLDENYLKGQIGDIKELSDYITTLTNVGSGLGEYSFDKETLDG
ncbi:hypothetical protein LSH36_50g05058 [Paralvinella palmiformis]|uniref:Ferritin n=1 Tax=Paralvinella palmiformis TaxID=53620 RepID=A0AAD9K696_9ANNE|nr:hypothetical protein LSH36_50g05058 [Paralvinella palmiformis]